MCHPFETKVDGVERVPTFNRRFRGSDVLPHVHINHEPQLPTPSCQPEVQGKSLRSMSIFWAIDVAGAEVESRMKGGLSGSTFERVMVTRPSRSAWRSG